jgi:DNA-binding MarR family transcriptional regulator
MRRRDSLLEALLVFRTVHPRITSNEMVAFLYTCENEGLSVQELAFITGMSQSAASRNLRALGPAGSAWALPPGLGLIEPFLSTTDGRSHVLMLSEAGRELRDRLDEIIGEAAPITLAKA